MGKNKPDHDNIIVDEMTEETQPADNKKVKVYLLLSVGLIVAILGIMTVWDIVTRQPKPSTQTASTPPAQSNTPAIQSGQDFSKLVEQRTVSRPPADKPKITTAQNNPYQAQVDKMKAEKEKKKTSRDFTLIEREDPKKAAKIKWEIAEMQRAFGATQSAWRNKNTPTQPASEKTNTASRHSNSRERVDARRQQVAKHIEDLSKLQHKLSTSDGSYIPNLESLTLSPSQRSEVQRITQTFDEPPQDIAGYTKENSYNANITGKYKLPIGTVIPAITAMKTMSDYTGTLKGFTTQDIYDIEFQHVLIPKGSEVMMKSVRISNVNEPIQARMGLTVPWVILPNGRKIDLSKSSGLDREGVGAIKDKVDHHFMAQFLGVAAYALIAGGSSYDGTGTNNDSSFASDVSENARQQFAPLAQKYLSLVPTITIEAGQSMNIILEEELYLDAWSDIYSDYM